MMIRIGEISGFLQDDSVVVNGVIFNKPFVEKPVDAEDHNIIIYYPVGSNYIIHSSYL